ncbi:hypothetical protein BaRGS_00020345 [Batillaria attramentaria]|uniref:Uncharacterized protein n=1 Tax=Batillaria attramentaria TaxID=370345 RepID=A0ABD0KMP8_9CAEN
MSLRWLRPAATQNQCLSGGSGRQLHRNQCLSGGSGRQLHRTNVSQVAQAGSYTEPMSLRWLRPAATQNQCLSGGSGRQLHRTNVSQVAQAGSYTEPMSLRWLRLGSYTEPMSLRWLRPAATQNQCLSGGSGRQLHCTCHGVYWSATWIINYHSPQHIHTLLQRFKNQEPIIQTTLLCLPGDEGDGVLQYRGKKT